MVACFNKMRLMRAARRQRSTIVQPVPDNQMPGEQELDGIRAYEAATDELIVLAQRSVRIFDRALGRAFNSAQRIDALSRLLLERRTNRVRIVVHDASNIVAECPRLMTLLRRFSDTLAIHQTLRAARGVYDPFAIADEMRFVHRFHYDSMRGVAVIGDLAATRTLISRFDDIWEASSPAASATTIGL
jgi:hypothetical protein